MTSSFLVDNYQILATYMATPIALMSALYIILLGYFVGIGKVEMSTQALLKLALTIGFVNMFALNWLYFSDYFVGIFLNGASQISSLGANSHYLQFAHTISSGSGINDALQTVLTQSVDVGINIMGHGGYTNWMPLFIGFNYIGGGAAIVALAMIEISMIKFFICLVLSTAPLFIAFYLFEVTQTFYKAWLSVLSGFSFALIYSGMTIGMAMKWMHWVVSDLHDSDQLDLKIYTLVPLFFVELLALVVFFSVIPLAKHIGGSIGSSQTGGAVGAGASVANAGAKAAKGASSLYNKWKNK